MTELTDEEAKALLAECDNPDCLTCEYARALLAARAERDQARADAQAAVALALVVERFRYGLQFMVDSIAEDKAYVADKYPALFKTIQARRAEMGTLGGVQVFGEIARDLLVLAPADGLAAVEALRVEARENAMQALASMGQAQEAYEAQLEAEAELARVRADAELALARVERLRHQITEASDPDFIWGAMDNVRDAETTLDNYAAAASRAIRGAMQIKTDAAAAMTKAVAG